MPHRKKADKMAKHEMLLGLFLAINLLSTGVNCDENGNFRVGVGIADITGPSADIGMVSG
jgi:hypothetical protein